MSSNIINLVKMDDLDPKYKRLKDSFKEEIRKRFQCDDYDPIVE